MITIFKYLIPVALFLFVTSSCSYKSSQINYSRDQVIMNYFKALNSLDPDLMDSCVTKNINRDDSAEIIAFFLGSEGFGLLDLPDILPPDNWLIFQNPEISMFGVNNIRTISFSNDIYTISYDKWCTQFSEDTPSASSLEIKRESLIEDFKLIDSGSGWKIERIDQIESNTRIWDKIPLDNKTGGDL